MLLAVQFKSFQSNIYRAESYFGLSIVAMFIWSLKNTLDWCQSWKKIVIFAKLITNDGNKFILKYFYLFKELKVGAFSLWIPFRLSSFSCFWLLAFRCWDSNPGRFVAPRKSHLEDSRGWEWRTSRRGRRRPTWGRFRWRSRSRRSAGFRHRRLTRWSWRGQTRLL